MLRVLTLHWELKLIAALVAFTPWWGPRSTIETGGEISTFPVDVSGSRRTIIQNVGLLLPASTYLTRERTVRVTVEIAEDRVVEPQDAHTERKKTGPR